jgi:hypothetical protein
VRGRERTQRPVLGRTEKQDRQRYVSNEGWRAFLSLEQIKPRPLHFTHSTSSASTPVISSLSRPTRSERVAERMHQDYASTCRAGARARARRDTRCPYADFPRRPKRLIDRGERPRGTPAINSSPTLLLTPALVSGIQLATGSRISFGGPGRYYRASDEPSSSKRGEAHVWNRPGRHSRAQERVHEHETRHMINLQQPAVLPEPRHVLVAGTGKCSRSGRADAPDPERET